MHCVRTRIVLDVADGCGWTRMLVLVIIALSGNKNTKNKTYLMNGTITWFSVDAQGGGSGRRCTMVVTVDAG